ncbi:TPA: tail fiber assembly protein [Escherichia coli]|uniref:tail fiber assembly protein n=1 Tax=Enterobacter asburiae TaxID=61645 RepID=UPI0032F5C926|nr:tail fiber assembly protein [Yersinia enterocolitica]
MDKAQLNHELIATIAGNITVFNFDGETREYLSSSVEYLAVGVGVPANSCVEVPGEARAGYAICRTQDLTTWEYIPDHRGKTVYSIHSGAAIVVSDLGDYPADTTLLAPGTPYDIWNGTAWVTDADKKHSADVDAAEQRKAALVEDARATISFWQTELQLGVISNEDKASLINWLAYIGELQALDTNSVPDISWPVPPA